MRHVTLLTIDATINLLLGYCCSPFPTSWPACLGCLRQPMVFTPTYSVGFCSGSALPGLWKGAIKQASAIGLGLGGAIAINLCGGLVLCGWLVFGDLLLPLCGLIFYGFWLCFWSGSAS